MSIKPANVLADFVSAIKWNDITSEVQEKAKLFILDYLASALAGYKVNSVFNDALVRVFYRMGGSPDSSVLFSKVKLPVLHAALLNGAYGHGADLDDGHRTAQGHPGVAIIPAALALGELMNADGRQVLLAVVAGYDIFVRLARSINPSHFSRGFHTTGTVGTIAAAGAAAKILNLNPAAARNALSLAALQSAGLLEVTESGQMSKPLHSGKAACNGVISALLAQEGVIGPQAVFEGEKGFFRAMTDEYDPEAIISGLGERFEIMSCYFKLYPSCRHSHGAIDCAIKLHAKGLSSPEIIDRIRIYTYPAAVKLTGSIFLPQSPDEAKFSLPYVVATALHRGNYTLDDLDAAKGFHQSLGEIIDKVEIIEDPKLEIRHQNIRGARVEVLLKDGTQVMEAVNLPKGDPEVPVFKEDIVNKLHYCARNILEEKEQFELIGLIDKFEELKSIKDLGRLLSLE